GAPEFGDLLGAPQVDHGVHAEVLVDKVAQRVAAVQHPRLARDRSRVAEVEQVRELHQRNRPACSSWVKRLTPPTPCSPRALTSALPPMTPQVHRTSSTGTTR